MHASTISITNPSFEFPDVGTGTYGAFTYLSGLNNGWTYGNGGNGVAGNGSGFTSGNLDGQDGTQVLFLQEDSSAAQLLSGFQAGLVYTLSFDLAARGNYGSNNQLLNVTLDSQSLISGLNITNSSYALETVYFTTTAGSHTLTFAGTTTGDATTDFIDAVSITDRPTAAPEPASMLLFGSGLIGVSFALRRRRR